MSIAGCLRSDGMNPGKIDAFSIEIDRQKSRTATGKSICSHHGQVARTPTYSYASKGSVSLYPYASKSAFARVMLLSHCALGLSVRDWVARSTAIRPKVGL